MPLSSKKTKQADKPDAAAAQGAGTHHRSFLAANIHRYPYLWVCFAMCVGVMGTALASPLYPLYQEAWNLSAGDITLVYVVYMASALAGLLFLGKLSDQHGFMPILRFSIILVTIGITFSAIAWSYASFSFSRVLIGMASSLIVTSASIGLTRLNRSSDLQRAAATTSLMLAFGFGLGPVIGGLIAQWSPAPLRISYVPSIVMGLLGAYALFTLNLESIGIKAMPSAKTPPLSKAGFRAYSYPGHPCVSPF
ncbi:MFS transporter [Paenalcaligenes niemegkensis]|uniref:MFS transporter n=1 Tax=Paenalcaligenes niemegkensis TaxID=2895469 RepID=UPI001EE97A55|nr:MFS transporter [Paenalcaligenes niemegkensis]MCQ9616172.1 MFS transporter [Paenalcaligenes niemegkensis]